jgi:hypothetical protein
MKSRGTERIEDAKNAAAVNALETYVRTLKEKLTAEELQQLDLHNTEHVHTAVLVDTNDATAVVAHWTFSKDPASITRLLASHRRMGVA